MKLKWTFLDYLLVDLPVFLGSAIKIVSGEGDALSWLGLVASILFLMMLMIKRIVDKRKKESEKKIRDDSDKAAVGYSFEQPVEEIFSVEIAEVLSEMGTVEQTAQSGTKTFVVQYDNQDVNLVLKTIVEISEDRFAELVERISAVEGSHIFNGNRSEVGTNVIFITYKNGYVEVIGHTTYWYTSKNGKVYPDCYVFENEQFYAILSSYINAS